MSAARTQINATGRRKTAAARVFLRPRVAGETANTPDFVVNKKTLEDYVQMATKRENVLKALTITERLENYTVYATVSGGGINGQADALRHGIARALAEAEPELHSVLRHAGLLTRDGRAVERKKPGKHKARKSTQFSKR